MITFRDFVLESINDKGRLKAIFFAGTPGSGKSYTLSKISSGSIAPRIVNTDKFYEFLAKQHKIDISSTTHDDGSEITDKSKQLTKEQLSLFLNGMLPLFIDGTSSDINNVLLRAGILESLGYDVGMIFIDTSLETSIKRAEKRERHVDPEFIKSVYELAEENKEYYKTKFEYFTEIKNDDGELTDDVIVKAYRKTAGFFTSDLKNPIGKRYVKKMEENKEKYLVPSIITKEELSKKLTSWYRN